jgi:hypothetical protein
MSVIVIARFSVPDVDAAVEWAKANASIPEEITAYGRHWVNSGTASSLLMASSS